MKKILIVLNVMFATALVNAQTLGDLWNQNKGTIVNTATQAAQAVINGTNSNTPSLTNEEIIKGLREALTVGTNSSTASASKADGYLKNTRLFIPWPEEAKDMKERLTKLGMKKQIADFETSLNRAAEEAAKKAAPVFIDAITKMSISDGMAILNGNDTAATNFLRKTSYAPLYDQFLPVVKEAIAKVNVTKYWNPLVTKYNKLPGVKKQNPNLDDYVTKKAANGLFVLIADEEAKIRKDPMARVTDILKKVFGFKK
ncbi:MAG: DUF4197 domain-containing protein [Bacteroidetes bacterium]|nr:DUF4197 domain-containing protein [Bacteroidota bacterium]